MASFHSLEALVQEWAQLLGLLLKTLDHEVKSLVLGHVDTSRDIEERSDISNRIRIESFKILRRELEMTEHDLQEFINIRKSSCFQELVPDSSELELDGSAYDLVAEEHLDGRF